MSADEHARPDVTADVAAAERGRLFGLAYRMLGTVAEAEDAVGEALARWATADATTIDNPAAWLTTVTTRVCLDRLRSAQRRREAYVGPWLPEPLPTGRTADDAADPADALERAESLTLAFLVVLESLTPDERAVFLLHDVFGHSHAEVAAMLGRSPTSSRTLVSRARRHLATRRPDDPGVDTRADAVTDAFLAACAGGDLDGVLALLAPDVTFVSDGGGRATAVPAPVRGAGEVGRMLVAFARTGQRRGGRVTRTELNATPAILVHEGDAVVAAMTFSVLGERITAIHAVRNPDKLTRLV